jgi:DNA-binding response OmpR family regulator
LTEAGAQVSLCSSSADLLARDDVFGFGFYIVDLDLPGVDGLTLISLLRRRTEVGVLALSSRTGPELFRQAVEAGADMVLDKPLPADQVLMAVLAVHRRAAAAAQVNPFWTLDRRAGQLLAPSGERVDLSPADRLVLEAFVEAQGEVVTREALHRRLGHVDDKQGLDSLNATIYRLRRRIQRVAPQVVPLQSRSRVGYVFRAPLKAI